MFLPRRLRSTAEKRKWPAKSQPFSSQGSTIQPPRLEASAGFCGRTALPSEPARSAGGVGGVGGVGGIRQCLRSCLGRLRRHSPGKAQLPQGVLSQRCGWKHTQVFVGDRLCRANQRAALAGLAVPTGGGAIILGACGVIPAPAPSSPLSPAPSSPLSPAPSSPRRRGSSPLPPLIPAFAGMTGTSSRE